MSLNFWSLNRIESAANEAAAEARKQTEMLRRSMMTPEERRLDDIQKRWKLLIGAIKIVCFFAAWYVLPLFDEYIFFTFSDISIINFGISVFIVWLFLIFCLFELILIFRLILNFISKKSNIDIRINIIIWLVALNFLGLLVGYFFKDNIKIVQNNNLQTVINKQVFVKESKVVGVKGNKQTTDNLNTKQVKKTNSANNKPIKPNKSAGKEAEAKAAREAEEQMRRFNEQLKAQKQRKQQK